MKSFLVKIQLLLICSFDKETNKIRASALFFLNILSRFVDSFYLTPSKLSLYLSKRNILIASYSQWRKFNEQPITHIPPFNNSPLISILIPTYNPDLKTFIACINSVLNQDYNHWELCIADDNSSSKEHIIFLTQLQDSRVKIIQRESNGHISECTNTALKHAEGKFVLLLDQDDALNKRCLFEFIKIINEDSEADFIYADEDLLTNDKRHSPAFKPDFSPQTLLSRNYITHPVLIKKELVNRVNGFRIGYEGSQDHDLFLRISSLSIKTIHIPKVLYHWRTHDNSTAQSISNKPYIVKASHKAINEFIGSSKLIVSSPSKNFPNYYSINNKEDLSNNLQICQLQSDGTFKETGPIGNYEYILFLGEELTVPDKKQINEALTILKYTQADSVGGAIQYKNKMLPSVYFLFENQLETFYSYKKYPFTGYHGFGLAISNVDALNPYFWFIKSSLWKNHKGSSEKSIKQFAFKVFSDSIENKTGYHVFNPNLNSRGTSKSKLIAEDIYNFYRKKTFQNNSIYLSKNIALTKRGFYFNSN